ncbi:MAG: hypothetical protein EBT07_12185 [Actinobacteria bacterium]|nr:hypothetical protein [Actinomycetota bacterium]
MNDHKMNHYHKDMIFLNVADVFPENTADDCPRNMTDVFLESMADDFYDWADDTPPLPPHRMKMTFFIQCANKF